MTEMPNFDYEKETKKIYGANFIAGMDEVGRGALAGPIVAATVIFNYSSKPENVLMGVNDSKKISAAKREELDALIRSQAAGFAYGLVEPSEIDRIGIGAANILAFKKALDGLPNCDFALIDGRRFRGFNYKYRCLEKGESKSLSIAAASILAKVYRDKIMTDLHLQYPDYDLVNNKGYGSAKHLSALAQLGPAAIHRRSFLKFLTNNQGMFHF